MTIQEFQVHQIPAHELYGDFWFNSEPVPITALRGRVILLDFWDYTDCSCLRSLPYVKEWHRRYARHGLVVVGVHTPKFPFGKVPSNVQRAIERLGIEYPVVMDNEAMVWSSYNNRVWPTRQVIDKSGFVRCVSTGEGSYGTMEQLVQSLLYNAGVTEELPIPIDPIREADRTGAVSYKATPELHAGYLRGSVGNVEGYSPESTVEYADPKIYYDGRFYIDGNWLNGRNLLRHQSIGDEKGEIIISYQGVEVNAVLDAADGRPFEMTVQQDDRFLSLENKGDDIQLNTDGGSILQVADPRMYNVVRNKEFGGHVLRLSTRSNACELYSLSFVSSVIPELISNN